MDHCFLVFIKKIYTIIMCLYYIDLLYIDIFLHYITLYNNMLYPLGYDEPCPVGLVDPHSVIICLPTGVGCAMNGVN